MVLAQPGPRTPNLKLKFTGDSAANDNFVKLDNFAGTAQGIVGTATIDFDSLTGPDCNETDVSVPGVRFNGGSNDEEATVLLSLPATVSVVTKSIFMAWVPGNNLVAVRHCCLTGTCNPTSAVYTFRVFNPEPAE